MAPTLSPDWPSTIRATRNNPGKLLATPTSPASPRPRTGPASASRPTPMATRPSRTLPGTSSSSPARSTRPTAVTRACSTPPTSVAEILGLPIWRRAAALPWILPEPTSICTSPARPTCWRWRETAEPAFPLLNAQQSCLNQANQTSSCTNSPTATDAFVAKINPNTTRLI